MSDHMGLRPDCSDPPWVGFFPLVLCCHSDLGLLDLCFGRSAGFRGRVGSTERGQRLQKCPGTQGSTCKGAVTVRGEERLALPMGDGLCSGPSCDLLLLPPTCLEDPTVIFSCTCGETEDTGGEQALEQPSPQD